MNVIINPSGQAGFSFKGLHNYCAHDKTGSTSERVEWTSTLNLAASPNHAYKSMINTAESKNLLKRRAGVRAGRPSENGDVLHIVMCYDIDEPWDKETGEAAAKDLLSRLGSTRAKSSGVRQFADEHQVVMYAHNDTKNRHVHLMVNRVHPQHGRALPDSNDQLKASRWALGFSKKHGTAHKTPAREENMAARDRGEYVKAKRRKSRKAYEEEKDLTQISNDNSRAQTFLENQKRKDAALYAKGRALAERQQERSDDLERRFEQWKAEADEVRKVQINKARSEIREEFRPLERALKTRQSAEQKTFDALEQSFFGRTKNAVKAVRDAFDKNDKGLISRSFRVLSNAGDRRSYFERGQKRERDALERQRTAKLLAEKHSAIAKWKNLYSYARANFFAELNKAREAAAAENAELKVAWKVRNEERKSELAAFPLASARSKKAKADFSYEAISDQYRGKLNKAPEIGSEFDDARQSPAREQDNSKDDDWER